jgi:hypothetical protein
MAIVGALALGIGLAFGLGGRETAAEILRTWYSKARDESSEVHRLAEVAGEKANRAAGAAPWPTDGYPQGGGSGGPVPAGKRHDSDAG